MGWKVGCTARRVPRDRMLLFSWSSGKSIEALPTLLLLGEANLIKALQIQPEFRSRSEEVGKA